VSLFIAYFRYVILWEAPIISYTAKLLVPQYSCAFPDKLIFSCWLEFSAARRAGAGKVISGPRVGTVTVAVAPAI
jgi:hypothetical protein